MIVPATSNEPQNIFHGVDPGTLRAMTRSLAAIRAVKADSSIYKIDDRIFLGSLGAALDRAELCRHNISHIVCVARGIRSIYPEQYSYKQIHILDSASESLLDHLPDCLDWMHKALTSDPKAKILVHCFAGRSRSVSIILAYLMVWHRITLRVALHHIRSIRPAANPNTHFMRHLKAFELELFARYGGPPETPARDRDPIVGFDSKSTSSESNSIEAGHLTLPTSKVGSLSNGPGLVDVLGELTSMVPSAKARLRLLEHTQRKDSGIATDGVGGYVTFNKTDTEPIPSVKRQTWMVIVLAVLIAFISSIAHRLIISHQ